MGVKAPGALKIRAALSFVFICSPLARYLASRLKKH